MKKILAGLFIIVLVAATVVFVTKLGGQTATAETDYLRIHVRANSNDQIDQSVKYLVKDEVVKFITPYAAQCTDKAAAIEVIGGILGGIEEVCDEVLRQNGFSYTSRASIRAEEFPTRVYGDLTLESGIYDALIIELGTGTGDNWWCVIYPPLCFTAATADVEYRSAILDIINKFFKR
ncbi:MAG: stage II sporulation protein R [Clostridia bacterium]|nr:stage II sporulation protein R [Clostridia bacterium]